MDALALRGTLGVVDTIPQGCAPGSDVANLSVLGYDPQTCFTGRGPLEAANMGVELSTQDIAFRCNLVTVLPESDPIMMDYSAGHISTEEAEVMIRDIDKAIGSPSLHFYPGVSYRNLMVWKSGEGGMITTPPHDIVGEHIANHMPRGVGALEINRLMSLSMDFLRNHPLNLARISRGMNPANAIWLWGQGGAPEMVPITRKYGIRGGIISAVNLLNGIGHYAGLELIKVEGATGYIDTNYRGKAQKALGSLRNMDFVFVHVEAPDEMGHEGNIEGKIKAIEDFDEKVVGTVMQGFSRLNKARIMVLSDHPTPIRLKTHVSDPSPFVVFSSVADENLCNGTAYGEVCARKTGIVISPGHLLIDRFILDWGKFIAEKRQ
jgi:2,3-bisphosphoglycerate-independent phosphoglycerate mutase